MMVIPSEQCCAIWKDNSHTKLEAMLRYYIVETYQGKDKKSITKVEHWTMEGVTYYILQDNKLILDSEKYLDSKEYSHFTKGGEARSWGKVPFICFKNNRRERPDIRFVKSLVDNYDKSRSDTGNFLEDVKNLIYVLKNYGGEDLAQFMRDLNYYRAIKVDDDGGVDTLNPELDITAAKEHYEQLKRDIIEFGQGTNKDLDKFGSSPSGIALKFLYSGLDLKCNHMEAEFKRGFQELLYFINVYLAEIGQGPSDIDVDIVFNRDVTINETEAINNCTASQGIISDETIITNHPWVKDVEEEIKKVTAEKKQKLKDQQEAFAMPVNEDESTE
jgi:SPP1 family phage portal protein